MTARAATDARFMRRALVLARRGWGRTAPNPMVGAVIVHDGAVVGEGFHAALGAPHAEVMALAVAGTAARGATVYVTLEPCAHTGRTPPCTAALIEAGVARVVYAIADPHPAASGGAALLRAAGVVVEQGVESAAASELCAPFLHRFRSSRPFITLKLATSIDGAIADNTGLPGWFTGPASVRAVHVLRAGHDAIAVGSGTALTDDPLLTVRGVRRPRVAPARVVFDRRGRLDARLRLVRSADRTPTIIVTSPAGAERLAPLESHGVRLIIAGDIVEGLERLREDGVDSLLCEGGAGLAGELLGHGLVDRLVIFQAPILLGQGALAAFGSVPGRALADASRWRVIAHEALGDDLVSTFVPAV
jgi:diaminohydroxyphosphoribosylaminopyrimidine deaminase/5-amino-6-(5-phosphoribosylamino)uracil reductase